MDVVGIGGLVRHLATTAPKSGQQPQRAVFLSHQENQG